jgi:hypothetical protein
MPSDITWQQLATAAPTDAIKVVNGDVVISVSKLTGDTIGALSSEGVIEFCNKMLANAESAQATINANGSNPLVTPNRLRSFSTGYSTQITVIGGTSYNKITRSLESFVALDENNPRGING